MVYGDERRTSLSGFEKLPQVEVTQEQMRDRFRGWVEQAREHAGELVVTYEPGRDRPEYWPVHMGVILADLADLDTVEDPEEYVFSSRFDFSAAPTVASDGASIREFDSSLHLGFLLSVYDSFQLVRPSFLSDEDVPRFQIAFGNEAVAEWFSKNGHLRGVTVGKYVEMARRLGVEPIITPETEDYIAERRQVIIRQLVDLALERTGVKRKVDAVYGSVGGGAQSLYGGLAIGMPPQSTGEANLRTSGDRRLLDEKDRTIQRLMQELSDLRFDESEYYKAIAQQLGLDLPAKRDAEAKVE